MILPLAAIGVLLPAAHASAATSLAAGVTFPATVSVGDSGQQGVLSIRNVSTPPQNAGNVTLTAIRLTPSCGNVTYPCAAPDPGVFTLNPTATGATGTACAGATFTIGSPSASNEVTITPTGPSVVLGPPASATDTCQINFTFSVAKVPTIDSQPATPGLQTTQIAFAAGTASTDGSTGGNVGVNATTVNRDNPAVGVQASSSTAVGGSITGTATISGGTNPTGSVTITLFGPTDPTCSGSQLAATSKTVTGNGAYASDPFVTSQPGTYRYIATYSGDVNNAPASTACGAAGSEVVVTAPGDPGGGDPGGGSGGGDTTAPETQITAGPKSKTKKKAARFEFSSNEPGSSFQCKLDGGSFAPCTSPHEVKVGKGKHTLEVRATDSAGNPDPTPATFAWTVKKKKKN